MGDGRRIEVVGVYDDALWARVSVTLAERERAEVVRVEGPAEEIGAKVWLVCEGEPQSEGGLT